MIQWIPLTNKGQLDRIVEASNNVPCLIFKHSIRCSISTIAKSRLERDWDFTNEEIKPYYLDLITFREVSNAVSDQFNVYHESPQVLLIRNGLCTYDSSHLDISVQELRLCYSDKS